MIEITIDSKALEKAFAVAPKRVAEGVSREVGVWLVNGSSDFTRTRLSAHDDRNQADFLLRRPRTSQGLRRATGTLARDLVTTTPVVDDFAKLRSTFGWRTGKAARIARVHELGTVRYGGSLPDIVPKRAKFLAIPIRGGGASRGTKVTSVVKLKKVGIPPRLGFVKYWTDPKRIVHLTKQIGIAATNAIKKAVGRG